jgi:hypothetical protein
MCGSSQDDDLIEQTKKKARIADSDVEFDEEDDARPQKAAAVAAAPLARKTMSTAAAALLNPLPEAASSSLVKKLGTNKLPTNSNGVNGAKKATIVIKPLKST